MVQTPIKRQHNASAFRIGIVGGGQLAKMTAQAALQLGCELVILERNTGSPALSLCVESLIGDWDDPQQLMRLAGKVDVVSLENEFVDADALKQLEAAGYPLFPSANTIALVQDKLIQKQTLKAAGIAMPEFRQVDNTVEINAAAEEYGWPLVLKARRNGYDGKGNATIQHAGEIDDAWNRLDGDSNSLYVEAFCPFTAELAVMITRGQNGKMFSYPVVETIQKDHICHTVIAPADITASLARAASELAKTAVEAIDGVGTIGVEMFLTEGKDILLNEMAPRVHNSGHYTIEACDCSQFENHLRALLGWPLGSTRMRHKHAVMVNLLGAADGPGFPSGIQQALALDGVHVHAYGKLQSRIGRKMGHLTVVGDDLTELRKTAEIAAQQLQFGAGE